MGRAPQRLECGTGQSFEVRGEFVLSWIFWPETCCGCGLQWLVAERAQAWFQRCGKSFCEKGVWPFLDPWGQCAFAHDIHALERSQRWNCHSSTGFSPWTGCDNKGKNLVRDTKEKERVRRAILSLCWLASFLRIFWSGHGEFVATGFPSFIRAALWLW